MDAIGMLETFHGNLMVNIDFNNSQPILFFLVATLAAWCIWRKIEEMLLGSIILEVEQCLVCVCVYSGGERKNPQTTQYRAQSRIPADAWIWIGHSVNMWAGIYRIHWIGKHTFACCQCVFCASFFPIDKQWEGPEKNAYSVWFDFVLCFVGSNPFVSIRLSFYLPFTRARQSPNHLFRHFWPLFVFLFGSLYLSRLLFCFVCLSLWPNIVHTHFPQIRLDV